MTDLQRDACWLEGRDLRLAAAVTLAVALLAAGLPCGAQPAAKAADSQVDAAAIQAFTQRMRTLYPQTRIDELRATETPGLFEVVMGPNIAYIDASARYWTFGHRYDMVERRDITAARLAGLDKVDMATLPMDAALKTVRGSGKRVLHVFADPNCGYCKQLERSLAQLSDITVYTYLLPILSQDSIDKASAIWCAPQREAAWRAWMLDGVTPGAARACATPNATVAAVARRLHIEATPTLIAADGRKAPGAMPTAELLSWLDAVDTPVATRATSGATSVKSLAPAN